MRYIDERNKRTIELLEEAKAKLPHFCSEFFLAISQSTQPLTRLNYAYDLGVFFDFLASEVDIFVGKDPSDFVIADVERIETVHVNLFMESLATSNKERGMARKLSCLRSLFAWLFREEKIQRNILPRIAMPKIHDKPIVRLDDRETIYMIKSASSGKQHASNRHYEKDDTLSARDTVILQFFLLTGVRVSELVGLDIGDIDMENKSFRVTRKGGNETILYMTDTLHEIITTYLELRRVMQEEYADANAKTTKERREMLDMKKLPLFVQRDEVSRLGTRSVQKLVSAYAKEAAPLKRISPHKLRSTFGTKLYEATRDIYAVASVLGHKSVDTTRKHYADMSEDMKRDAMRIFEENAEYKPRREPEKRLEKNPE